MQDVKTLRVRMPTGRFQELADAAWARRLTMSALVRQAVEREIQQADKPQTAA